MSEKLCLKWNDYQDNTSNAFKSLKNDKEFSDVTLVCDDGRQTNAHKIILSNSSPFFKEILSINKHPHPLIYMRGLKSEDLMTIVDFIYIGEANIFQENLDSFLSLAQRLKILGLLQNDNPQGDVKAEQNANSDYEETLPTVNDSQDSIIEINSNKSNNEDLRNIERKVSLINGDQQEINVKVDEHIGVGSDRNIKCLICGKLGTGSKRSSDKEAMRNHVETHLEGISYQCTLCEKTFRSRNSCWLHKSRKHK